MTHPAPLIAVVDDEANVRTMLRRALMLADYAVETFEDGAGFLARLAEQTFDGVVLDIHMPGLSGFAVYDRMHAAQPRLPVVFITASDDPSLLRHLGTAHRVTLLHKPFSSDRLIATLERFLASGAGHVEPKIG